MVNIKDPIKKLYVSDDEMIGEDRLVPGTNEQQNDNDHQSAEVWSNGENYSSKLKIKMN